VRQYDLTKQEERFLSFYRSITVGQRQILDHLAAGFAGEHHEEAAPALPENVVWLRNCRN
jgi:hypothetical protein